MDRQLKPAVIPICLINLYQIYWKDSVMQATKYLEHHKFLTIIQQHGCVKGKLTNNTTC